MPAVVGSQRTRARLGPDRYPRGRTHREQGLSRTLDITALYRRYGDMVLGRCRTLLGNDADAQEAMQEVFLRVHRYKDSFRGEASPTTYLYRAATNVCLNRIRSKKRRPEDMMPEPPSGVTTDCVLDSLAIRQLVDELLSGEDERTQACVIYHYMDGMTHAETGAVLGIGAAAVRKRIAKFRSKVRENPPSWLLEAP